MPIFDVRIQPTRKWCIQLRGYCVHFQHEINAPVKLGRNLDTPAFNPHRNPGDMKFLGFPIMLKALRSLFLLARYSTYPQLGND